MPVLPVPWLKGESNHELDTHQAASHFKLQHELCQSTLLWCPSSKTAASTLELGEQEARVVMQSMENEIGPSVAALSTS